MALVVAISKGWCKSLSTRGALHLRNPPLTLSRSYPLPSLGERRKQVIPAIPWQQAVQAECPCHPAADLPPAGVGLAWVLRLNVWAAIERLQEHVYSSRLQQRGTVQITAITSTQRCESAQPELKLQNSRLWCELKEKDREAVEAFLV